MVNCAKIFSRDEILRIWKCPWSLQLTISTLQVYFCSPEVEVCIRTGIPSDPVIFYLFFFLSVILVYKKHVGFLGMIA